MSFILDALKKSENERQRQIGPSLADVKAVRRSAERPWWAVAVAALLVINLGVLLMVLMRDGDAKPAPQAPAPVQSQPQSQPYNQNPAAAPAQNYQQSYQQPYQPAPPPQGYSPAQAQAQNYPQGYGPPPPNQPQPRVSNDPSVRSLADEARGYEPYPYESMNPNVAGAAAIPEGPPMVRQIEPPTVAPLSSRAVFEARAAANSGGNAAFETLPTLNDLAAGGTNLPDLHLDIHVHSANPSERFVFVNMRKYLEGETLKEGPSVERITQEGVILNQRGLRFLLPRQ